MKNWKKAVAAFAAAAMTMSIGCVAFADAVEPLDGNVGASLTNPGNYIDSQHQWTVIIIPKSVQNKNALESSDLYYINQGTSADGFWTNMLTKGDKLADGTYLMRIGGTNVDSSNAAYDDNGYYEFEFTVVSEDDDITITFTWGDFNADGSVTLADVTNLVVAYLGGNKVFTGQDGYTYTYASGDIVKNDTTYTIEKGYCWGDINGDGNVTLADVTNTVVAYLGGNKSFTSSVLGETYTYGTSEVTLKITEK